MVSGKYQLLKSGIFATLFWIVPGVWLVLTFKAPVDAEQHTLRQVSRIHEAALVYRKEKGVAPPNLATLKASSAARGQEISFHDVWGNRLEYMRLSQRRWYIRSFGRDQTQNTLDTAIDPGIISFEQRGEPGLLYRYGTVPKMDMYPAILLVGSDSPARTHLARVYLDIDNRTRHLVVRDRNQQLRFMVAPHDAIEEFFWLPDGKRIVYSATASPRYSDGVFLWNLSDDSVTNLTPLITANLNLDPKARETPLWISLAGVGADGPTLYIYLAERTGHTLDPEVFFNKGRLTAVVLAENAKPTSLPTQELATLSEPPFSRPLDLTTHVDLTGASGFQKRWLELELHGDIETVLVKWQEFSQKYAKSPLFPYCLWYLSSIYAQSFKVVRGRDETGGDILRSYGAEIAGALSEYPHAPTYLQSLGRYSYERLTAGETLPYAFSEVDILSALPKEKNTGDSVRKN